MHTPSWHASPLHPLQLRTEQSFPAKPLPHTHFFLLSGVAPHRPFGNEQLLRHSVVGLLVSPNTSMSMTLILKSLWARTRTY